MIQVQKTFLYWIFILCTNYDNKHYYIYSITSSSLSLILFSLPPRFGSVPPHSSGSASRSCVISIIFHPLSVLPCT